MSIVSPSILSADFLNLDKEIKMLNESEADWIHVDVMDGMYVPNISFGFHIIKQISSVAQKPLDVHAMVEQPSRFIKEFKSAGTDILTIHLEAEKHLHRTVQFIKDHGMKAGVALNPHSSIQLLEGILPYVDLVLIMSVNPGFGGQTFIPSTYKRLEQIKSMISDIGYEIIVEVDGGVNTDNAPLLVSSGANALVAGNSVFSSDNPQKIISNLKTFC